MENIEKHIYQPAIAYLVITLIILFIKTLVRLKYRPFNLFAFGTQIGSIILCAIVLIGFCNFSCNFSWIIAIGLILCSLIQSIIAIKNWISFQPNKQKIKKL